MTLGRTFKLAAATLIAAWVGAALAEERGLLHRCWTPETLAGTSGELKPVRSHGGLDLAALRQEPLPNISPVPQELRGSLRSVELPSGEKLIALTFDLCETSGTVAGYDGRIVDLLRAQGVKATFFASGKWMETHAERTAQLLADPNFELGAHGLRHVNMAKLKGASLKDEIVLTEAAYVRARKSLLARQCAVPEPNGPHLPEHMNLMRFPFGTCSPAALAAVAEHGQVAIQWDVITGDPDPRRSARAIADTILKKVHPGAIVVAHANGRGKKTADALALAIPKLKEEGYGFVTVSELLQAGEPVIAANCYLERPRGTTRVARLSRRKTHGLLSIFGPSN